MNGKLSSSQINQLIQQGCTARDWSLVSINPSSNIASLRNCTFQDEVLIGDLSGHVKDAHGTEKPCGIYNATIINCNIV